MRPAASAARHRLSKSTHVIGRPGTHCRAGRDPPGRRTDLLCPGGLAGYLPGHARRLVDTIAVTPLDRRPPRRGHVAHHGHHRDPCLPSPVGDADDHLAPKALTSRYGPRRSGPRWHQAAGRTKPTVSRTVSIPICRRLPRKAITTAPMPPVLPAPGRFAISAQVLADHLRQVAQIPGPDGSPYQDRVGPFWGRRRRWRHWDRRGGCPSHMMRSPHRSAGERWDMSIRHSRSSVPPTGTYTPPRAVQKADAQSGGTAAAAVVGGTAAQAQNVAPAPSRIAARISSPTP